MTMVTATNVKGVMTIETIASRAGSEPTSLALWASVLTITPPNLHDVITLPTSTCLCVILLEKSVHLPRGIVCLLVLTIAYIEAITLHIHTVGLVTVQYITCT